MAEFKISYLFTVVTLPTPVLPVDPALYALLASMTLSSREASGAASGESSKTMLVDVLGHGTGELLYDFLASLEAVAVEGIIAIGTDVSLLQVRVNSVREMSEEELYEKAVKVESKGSTRFNSNLVFLRFDVDQKCCGNIGHNSKK